MLTFHILNVYVDKTQPRQFKFTFKHWSSGKTTCSKAIQLLKYSQIKTKVTTIIRCCLL